MNVPERMRGSSYIVDWRKIVGENFMPEFVRVVKALHYAGKTGLVETEKRVKAIMESMTEENREKYKKIRWKMRECGYYVDKWDIPHLVGWCDTIEIVDDQIKFYTTAPPPRQFIGTRSFMDFKREFEGKGGKPAEDLDFVEEPYDEP